MKILITGGNRGLGAALVSAYRARGDDVTGTSRQGDAGITLDVADAASCAALGPALGAAPLDLLVCNAGVLLDKHDSIDGGYPATKWAETFAVNCTGTFLCIQALLPNLIAAKGKIAIISSQLGSDTIASGGRYIYSASKAASLNLGRNLAVDLRGDGVAVGVYHPGWVQTDMGGAQAAITPEASAAGLMARFDALSLATTGCFETWDGESHPF